MNRCIQAVLLFLCGCDSSYSTMTLCLDADLNELIIEEHMHERDIYNEDDTCEEAGGTWYWQCVETLELHPVPDDEYPLYHGASSNMDVCPR